MTDAALAAFDARVDALPADALAGELDAIDAWGRPLRGRAPQSERVAFIRARLAIQQPIAEIRAEHPEWWQGGKGRATERMWRRDCAAARGRR